MSYRTKIITIHVSNVNNIKSSYVRYARRRNTEILHLLEIPLHIFHRETFSSVFAKPSRSFPFFSFLCTCVFVTHGVPKGTGLFSEKLVASFIFLAWCCDALDRFLLLLLLLPLMVLRFQRALCEQNGWGSAGGIESALPRGGWVPVHYVIVSPDETIITSDVCTESGSRRACEPRRLISYALIRMRSTW